MNTAFGVSSFSSENTMIAQPPMSKHRVDLIRKAFSKADRTQDGNLTIEDLRGCVFGFFGLTDGTTPHLFAIALMQRVQRQKSSQVQDGRDDRGPGLPPVCRHV